MNKCMQILLLSSLFSGPIYAHQLLSDSTIAVQQKNTFQFELPGNIPVVYRKLDGSDIFLIATVFAYGEAHVPKSEQSILGLTVNLMERGSKKWPKDKLYAIMEHYTTRINCNLGVETSSCSLATLTENLEELLPVYASVILEPQLDSKEASLLVQQSQASILGAMQNPESYVNEVVNSLFYGPNHPYWTPMELELSSLKKIDLSRLASTHKNFLLNSQKVIIVVGGMPVEELKSLLTKHLSGLKQGKSRLEAPVHPTYSAKKSFSIHDRDIPTAYIRAKFSLPGITEKDGPATSLMMRILSEELESEIRTKRSLSYSVFAQDISMSAGIGVIHASTSHPKETLEAIVPVIKKIQDEKLSQEELDRHKTVFTTSYFLTLEDHASLAGGLASSQLYFGNSDRLYLMPRELEKLSPDDIQRVARQYLKKFRLGVVFKQKEFKKEWAEKFLKDLK